MTTSELTLHIFASVKGGVGKSTLAVGCASVVQSRGGRCVVLDLDLTGTSLMDGLDLCAPRDDGAFYSRTETLRLRDMRQGVADEVTPRSPRFVNDVILELSGVDPVPVLSRLWSHAQDDGVRYLPASSLQSHVALAADWLAPAQQEEWSLRLVRLFDRLATDVPGLTDIVIDLPPGLYGFAYRVLTVASYLARQDPLPPGYPQLVAPGRTWSVRPFLITSADRNDLYGAVESVGMLRAAVSGLRVLVNRLRSESIERIRAVIVERFGPTGIEMVLEGVHEREHSLGRVFRDGHLALASEDRSLLERSFLRSTQ